MEVSFALAFTLLLTFSGFLASFFPILHFIDWLDFDNWHIFLKTIVIGIIEWRPSFHSGLLDFTHLNIISNIKQVKEAEYIIGIFSS